jgi:hypothetical protein
MLFFSFRKSIIKWVIRLNNKVGVHQVNIILLTTSIYTVLIDELTIFYNLHSVKKLTCSAVNINYHQDNTQDLARVLYAPAHPTRKYLSIFEYVRAYLRYF